MSGSCVITNEEGWLKRSSARNDLCRPRFAILNPRLTYTLPQYQTESGCVVVHDKRAKKDDHDCKQNKNTKTK